MLVLYLIQRSQQWLPWNPQGFGAVAPDLAFNTAASFTTNTNWQAYGGEATMSYLTQMAGLAYHNFVSAATGIALAIAFIRGISQKEKDTLGNFWVDLVRCSLWVLLPFCIVGALALVSQGVVQNLRPYDKVTVLDRQTVTVPDATGKPRTVVSEQVIAQGFALIFPEEQRAQAEEQYRAAFAADERAPRCEIVIRRADGAEVPVESCYDFVPQDGRRSAMVSKKTLQERSRPSAKVRKPVGWGAL